MWFCTPLIPSLGRQGQMDLYKFEAIWSIYRVLGHLGLHSEIFWNCLNPKQTTAAAGTAEAQYGLLSHGLIDSLLTPSLSWKSFKMHEMLLLKFSLCISRLSCKWELVFLACGGVEWGNWGSGVVWILVGAGSWKKHCQSFRAKSVFSPCYLPFRRGGVQ